MSRTKKFSAKIFLKHIKRIPKGAIRFWLLTLLCLVACSVLLFSSKYYQFNDLEEFEIKIEQVNLRDTYDTKGSRMKLEIISNNTMYYVLYPQSNYLDFANDIKNDLLTGNVTLVYVKLAPTQTLRNRLFDHKRVVDIRSNTTVYYDLDIEIITRQSERVVLCVLFIFIFVLLVFYTIVVLLLYNILTFKKR